jgi:zinc/manganese transport system permease protein
MTDFLAALSEPFTFRFVARGMAMAFLLGVAGGLVGSVLLLRRIVLMADSFGHALLPGIGLAYIWFGPGQAGLFVGAAVAGLGTALMSGVINRLTRLQEDAAFGSLFVLCFAAGVMLMSRVAAPMDLMHYLFGNILAVTAADLVLVCCTTCATVLAFCVFYRSVVMDTFDPAFHRVSGGHSLATHLGVLAAVVLNLIAALQAVGMVLALGLFILPAATAYLWCERFGAMLLVAAIYGGVMSCVGLLVSWHLDLPSGACMVAALGSGFIVSLLSSPRHGLLARLRPAHRHFAHDEGAEECAVPPSVATGAGTAGHHPHSGHH